MNDIRLIYNSVVDGAYVKLISAWFPDNAEHRQLFLRDLEKAIAAGGPGAYVIESRAEQVPPVIRQSPAFSDA